MDQQDNGKALIEMTIISAILEVVERSARHKFQTSGAKISSPFDIVGDDQMDGFRLFTTQVPKVVGRLPYQTLVHHENYGHDAGRCRLIAVEAYTDRDQAMLGHERWLKTLSAHPLPKTLVEIKNEYVWDETPEDVVYPWHGSKRPKEKTIYLPDRSGVVH